MRRVFLLSDHEWTNFVYRTLHKDFSERFELYICSPKEDWKFRLKEWGEDTEMHEASGGSVSIFDIAKRLGLEKSEVVSKINMKLAEN